MRDTADEREIAVRLRQLAALGRPAGEAVPPVLPPTLRPSALRLAAVLSSPPGRLVPTAELEGADGSRLPLDELLAELRDVLEPGGWSIEAVGTTGYVLVRSDVSVSAFQRLGYQAVILAIWGMLLIVAAPAAADAVESVVGPVSVDRALPMTLDRAHRSSSPASWDPREPLSSGIRRVTSAGDARRRTHVRIDSRQRGCRPRCPRRAVRPATPTPTPGPACPASAGSRHLPRPSFGEPDLSRTRDRARSGRTNGRVQGGLPCPTSPST